MKGELIKSVHIPVFAGSQCGIQVGWLEVCFRKEDYVRPRPHGCNVGEGPTAVSLRFDASDVPRYDLKAFEDCTLRWTLSFHLLFGPVLVA